MDRIPGDQYFTDSRLILPLSDLLGKPKSIFEPCCGTGQLVRPLRDLGHSVMAADVDVSMESDFHFDATSYMAWQSAKSFVDMDWVVTNPPYKQPDCQQIIENAWEFCGNGMAMLLRLSYLEPCANRVEFLRSAWLSHLIIFNPRPRFRLDTKGSDSSTSAWFIWQKAITSGNTTIINLTNWNNAQLNGGIAEPEGRTPAKAGGSSLRNPRHQRSTGRIRKKGNR